MGDGYISVTSIWRRAASSQLPPTTVHCSHPGQSKIGTSWRYSSSQLPVNHCRHPGQSKIGTSWRYSSSQLPVNHCRHPGQSKIGTSWRYSSSQLPALFITTGIRYHDAFFLFAKNVHVPAIGRNQVFSRQDRRSRTKGDNLAVQ